MPPRWRKRHIPYSIKCFTLTILFAGMAKAQIASLTRNVIIEQPTDLPEQAQSPANALYLNADSGDGSAYPYIEQQNGRRLVVLDVTDLARIRKVRTEDLALPGPFESGERVDGSFVVLRSLGNQEMAILNLRKTKLPVIQTVDALQRAGRITAIGRSTFLLTAAEFMLRHESVPQGYTVVDVNKSTTPTVLYTAKFVKASVTRGETGTIFLRGAEGLTVIRHPEAEQEYEIQQRVQN